MFPSEFWHVANANMNFAAHKFVNEYIDKWRRLGYECRCDEHANFRRHDTIWVAWWARKCGDMARECQSHVVRDEPICGPDELFVLWRFFDADASGDGFPFFLE